MESTCDRQVAPVSIGWVCKEDAEMELGTRLKEYRNRLGMTQDDLAERLFVSRQTVSAWENDKTYPDIHSLLMLSDLFDVSLDTLVKGDIEIMKETIDRTDIRSFRRDSNIFTVLLLLCIITVIPLYKWLGIPGFIIWGVLFAVTIYFAVRVEKVKKAQDIYTYREIVAFTNGEKLDSIEKAREEGKQHYRHVALAVGGAAIGLAVAWLFSLII